MRHAVPVNFLSDIVTKPTNSTSDKNTDNLLQKYKEIEDIVMNAGRKVTQKSNPVGIKNDPYKVGNAIVMEINNMAGQLF